MLISLSCSLPCLARIKKVREANVQLEQGQVGEEIIFRIGEL